MRKFWVLLIIISCVFLQNVLAQIDSNDDTALMMTGEFSDKQATGIYVKGKDDETLNMNWSTFLGSDDKVYKITLADDKLVELFIDGQKISSENFLQHSAATKPFLDNLAAQKQLEKEQNDIDLKTEEIDAEAEEIDRNAAKLDRANAKIDEINNRSADLTAERENISKLRGKISKLRDSISKKRDLISEKREILSEKREKNSYQQNYIDKVLQKIISDLRTEGIIKSQNNVSFKLSNRELIVNGKQQSADVHQKLKAKYVAESANETGFVYRWKGKI